MPKNTQEMKAALEQENQIDKGYCNTCEDKIAHRTIKDIQKHISSDRHKKNMYLRQLENELTSLLRESPVVTDQYNIRPRIRDIHNCVYEDISDDNILGEAAVKRVIKELKLQECAEDAAKAGGKKKGKGKEAKKKEEGSKEGAQDGSSSATASEDPSHLVYNPSAKSKLKERFDELRVTLENVKIGEITSLVQQMMMVFAMSMLDAGETLETLDQAFPEFCEEKLQIVPQGPELARYYCGKLLRDITAAKLENNPHLLNVPITSCRKRPTPESETKTSGGGGEEVSGSESDSTDDSSETSHDDSTAKKAGPQSEQITENLTGPKTKATGSESSHEDRSKEQADPQAGPQGSQPEPKTERTGSGNTGGETDGASGDCGEDSNASKDK